jgi:hypothetical protein
MKSKLCNALHWPFCRRCTGDYQWQILKVISLAIVVGVSRGGFSAGVLLLTTSHAAKYD